MSEEETNQTQPEEVNPDAPVTPSGEAGAGEGAQGEPTAGAEESVTLSREEFETYKQALEGYKEIQPAFTRATQDVAELRRREEEWAQQRAAFLGQQQAQQDPLEAAMQEYAQAEESFDPALKQQAFRKAIAVAAQQAAQQASQQAVQTMRVERGLQNLGEQYGPVTPEELTDLRRKMTPEQELKALALLKLEEEGKLPQTILSQQQARETKAQETQRLQAMLADHGARMVPGTLSAEGGEERPRVPASVYYGLSKKAAEKKWPNAIIEPG